ncbi:hypothetical protein POM88_035573 [Heracleum sosnowskyi]|uniref:TTF-type domain-containing protein n=1 Tax=Heracleum sosnowskyi TaxID=360622 RepID=A0AAD8MDE5_9APIA|nr:hypothetical protein POM88_035573 [Heracleum sosnowskyi]
MKRSSTRDISTFFTKKPTTENVSQAQANEPEINIPRSPATQPSQQGSSPTPSITLVPPQDFDTINYPQDPGKRKKLIDFHPNERDLVRRIYIQRGPCQPKDYVFPQTLFGKNPRRFNVKWFETWRPWLEYSVSKDAAFCFICYLFKSENTAGGDAFVGEGFKCWNRLGTIRDHVGKHMSSHNNAVVAMELFKKQKGSIASALSKQTEEVVSAYRKRLEASITAIRWLLLQGLPFRGHDESENSMNRGNFMSLLTLLSEHDPEYSKVVLKMAPGNCQLTSPIVQKDIINACAKETTKAILESLDAIAEVSDTIDSNKAQSITHLLMSFDFVFVAHLMVAIFGITNELNVELQKHDQDIVNAMAMVDITKTSLQKLRDEGWNFHMDKVTSFLVKYGVEVPNMEANYIIPGRRMYRGKSPQITNFHHFRVEVFLSVIDLQLQELENRFPEVSKELLMCMSCFNPANRFAAFDKSKLTRLAGFYPSEFSSTELLFFEHSLENFIVSIREDERFWDLKNLGELSMKLVETGKSMTHERVYLLLKLVLILPVATASVERVFSGMTQVKVKLRNSMGDQMLNDFLITYQERDLFLNVKMSDIIDRYQNMKTRREQL